MKVTDGDSKRRTIFDKYTEHLSRLVQAGLIDLTLKYDRTYICPICTEQFSEESLDQNLDNPLTLEDSPPKSLGGSANVLTCRRCNNISGQQIEHHLSNRMRELDNSSFLPKSEFAAQFERNGKIVEGIIRVEDDGVLKAIHHNKKNNPKNLLSYIASLASSVGAERIASLIFKKLPVDERKVQIALLKVGYLLTFEKFGYAFLLDSNYDRIRAQLRLPDQELYPLNFWVHESYLAQFYGVHLLVEENMSSIAAIFPLSTTLSQRPFLVLIPVNSDTTERVINEYNRRVQIQGSFFATFEGLNGIDFINDINESVKIIQWINSIQSKS